LRDPVLRWHRSDRQLRRSVRNSLAASWAQAITEIHQMSWPVRSEPTWGKQHWSGFVQHQGKQGESRFTPNFHRNYSTIQRPKKTEE
jgi:hypothetical protein